jgi:hypothetical protein
MQLQTCEAQRSVREGVSECVRPTKMRCVAIQCQPAATIGSAHVMDADERGCSEGTLGLPPKHRNCSDVTKLTRYFPLERCVVPLLVCPFGCCCMPR